MNDIQEYDPLKNIFQDKYMYEINEETKTAKIIGYYDPDENLFEKNIIPRSITYLSQDYLITSIGKGAYSRLYLIDFFEFSPDSAIKTIERESLVDAEIELLSIPASLTNLEEGWCCNVKCIKAIEISPDNPRYKKYNDKLIIGKSKIEQETYDTLIFCDRSVKTITIPNFIEIIDSYAFANCKKLNTIEFQNDSKLRIIKDFAFSVTDIEEFVIPPEVTEIHKYALFDCNKLKTILMNSKIEKIKKYAFSKTLINQIIIPPSLIEFDGRLSFNVNKLSTITIMPNNSRYKNYDNKFIIGKSSLEKDNFDVLLSVSNRSIETAVIPDFIEIIGQFAFCQCKNLHTIETSSDSKLRIIEKNAFYESSVESITIPKNFVELREKWCSNAFNLRSIKILPTNQHFSYIDGKYLMTKSSSSTENYDVLTFSDKDIENAKISSFVKTIDSFSFFNCKKLCSVEFSENSELDSIEKYAFKMSSIESISIPPHLTKICDSAFFDCKNLRCVEFPKNSELRFIGCSAFCISSIESITIPPHLTKICDRAFFDCNNLRCVEIPKNSELQIIGRSAFFNSGIESISFPPHLTEICDYAFCLCSNLRHIEFQPNSELKKIGNESFVGTSIDYIYFPDKLVSIGYYAFENCKNLKHVEFQSNSEIQSIEYGAFSWSSINCFSIPPKINKNIDAFFSSLENVQIIELGDNSELYDINIKLYYRFSKDALLMVSSILKDHNVFIIS